MPWLEQFVWLRNATQLHQGILCIDQEVLQDNIWETAELCSWGRPQHMSASQAVQGSPRELAGWANHLFLCKRDAFSGVLSQRASMDCLLPWAPPPWHTFSQAPPLHDEEQLQLSQPFKRGKLCSQRRFPVHSVVYTNCPKVEITG